MSTQGNKPKLTTMKPVNVSLKNREQMASLAKKAMTSVMPVRANTEKK